MITYNKAKSTDSSKMTMVHLDTFDGFFLSSLGSGFLNTYYNTCIKSPDAFAICATDTETEKIVGFGLGCYNSNGFNKKLIKRNFLKYLLRSILIIFTKPNALIRLLNNLTKRDKNENDIGDYGELFSIAVDKDYQGLGIGKNLLKKFEYELKQKSIKKITLTTDKNNNDNVLKFYRNFGYDVYYDFISYPKREMCKLKKIL
jgi:ribosomal protein S18 acetylase RimI-like enzyme